MSIYLSFHHNNPIHLTHNDSKTKQFIDIRVLLLYIFPPRWKVGLLLPLHKGKGLDRRDPTSYRPISLLPVLGKVTERLLQPQIMNFMSQSLQLNLNHHSYRKGHSTTTALLQLSDAIFQGCNENMITTLVTVDQSAAFDVIQHELLLKKLRLYNWGPAAVNWIQNYLSCRSDYVKIGTKSSRYRSIHHGVPQGSVLGPILYIIYINELPNLLNKPNCELPIHNENNALFNGNCDRCGTIPTYADDSTIVIKTKTRFEAQEKVAEKMQIVRNFLSNNSLSVNASKTEILEMMVQQKRRWIRGSPPQLTVSKPDGSIKVITAKESIRLLGVNLNQNCSWKHHLALGEKALLPALRSKIGALAHISGNIPRRSKLLLANGLIISKVMYLVAMWGGLKAGGSKSVQILLNKCARIVTGRPRKTRTRQLMIDCNWLYFSELVKFHSLLTLWKMLRWKQPHHLSRDFSLSDKNLVEMERGRLLITRRSFRHRSVSDWNGLNENLRSMLSFPQFKRELRKHIIETCPPVAPRPQEINWD